VSYSSTSGFYGDLTQLIGEGLIDGRYNSANFSGFTYTMDLYASNLGYTATATAVSTNMSRWDFYSTPDFVVRYSTDAARAPVGMAGQPVH
jgi:hypothetical protein